MPRRVTTYVVTMQDEDRRYAKLILYTMWDTGDAKARMITVFTMRDKDRRCGGYLIYYVGQRKKNTTFIPISSSR